MSVTRLIYASRPFGFDMAMLGGILTDARRCNARDGVTGALVCRADVYLQMLEGPADVVNATFARIGRDDRHLDVNRLIYETTEERLFPGWAMRDDPARSWMWSMKDVAAGAIERTTRDELLAVFDRLAREPDRDRA